MKKIISFMLNEHLTTVEVNPAMPVISLLRDILGLTGTKEGCGVGECGACTIIVDKKAVNSCIMVAGQLENRDVYTVEGLEKNGVLDVLQQAFIDENAVQCGFCTPGMLMSAKALLLNNPSPSPEEIKKAIAGNLCRCTGYKTIIKAVQTAANTINT